MILIQKVSTMKKIFLEQNKILNRKHCTCKIINFLTLGVFGLFSSIIRLGMDTFLSFTLQFSLILFGECEGGGQL